MLFAIPGLLAQGIVFLATWLESIELTIIGAIFILVLNLLMLRLYSSPMFIVDQGVPALESIKLAWKSTTGLSVRTLLLALVSGVIVVAGVLCLYVGVLFALPLAYLMWVSAYRQMTTLAEEDVEDIHGVDTVGGGE